MTKTERINQAHQHASRALEVLIYLRADLKDELQRLKNEEGVQDIEEIDPVKLYCLAQDLNFNIEVLNDRIDEMKSILSDLESINLAGL